MQKSGLNKSPITSSHWIKRYLMLEASAGGDTSDRYTRLDNPCGVVADSLVKVLCSHVAQVWDILVVMYASSVMGQPCLNICGPVGAGKGTESKRLSFFIFFVLLWEVPRCH